MNKLLNAGFARLRKSKLFWGLLLFMAALALLMIGTEYSDFKKYGTVVETEQLMLNYATIAGVVIAVFTSLFLGVEYSDGTIRNKISTGHRRGEIYLTNLLLTAFASLISYAVFLAVIMLVGIPLLGGVKMALPRLLMLLGCICLTLLVYSCLFTWMAMMISNRAVSAVACILVALGLMIAASACLAPLHAPEEILTATLRDGESGQAQWIYEPNPRYPSDAERQVYQYLVDVNPNGQMFQIAGGSATNLAYFPLYALGEMALLVGAGLGCFRKKEIK